MRLNLVPLGSEWIDFRLYSVYIVMVKCYRALLLPIIAVFRRKMMVLAGLLFVILLLINPIVALLALIVVPVLAALYFAALLAVTLASLIISSLVVAALAVASFIASHIVAIALAAAVVAAAAVAVALVVVIAENLANMMTNLTQYFRSWFNTPGSRDNEPVVAVPVASANHVPMAEVVYPDPHSRGHRFFNENIPPYNPAYNPGKSPTLNKYTC